MTPDDPMWDCLFHGSAWRAFSELAAACSGIPDSEAVRRLAYKYFEESLREKNAERPEETA